MGVKERLVALDQRAAFLRRRRPIDQRTAQRVAAFCGVCLAGLLIAIVALALSGHGDAASLVVFFVPAFLMSGALALAQVRRGDR